MKKSYPYLSDLKTSSKELWLKDPARRLLSAEDFERYFSYFKDFHRQPELSWAEMKTRARIIGIAEQIAGLDLLFNEDYGVLLAFRQKGASKKYLFRADMDALPIEEASGLDYSSEHPAVMHACGHDGHMTILLGLMEQVAKARAQLAKDCEFYFFFQAAEENLPSGAKTAVEAGLLESFGPFTAIYGYHLVPQLAAGRIGLLPAGPASTANGFFTIEIVGKSSHSSQPQLAINPIQIAAELITATNRILNTDFDPREYKLLSFCQVSAGTVQNQIPEQARLGGSIRVLNPETEDRLRRSVERICQSLAEAYGAKISFDYKSGHPAIDNSKELRENFLVYLKKRLSQERFAELPFWSASEDFAYYHALAPIYYFHIGSALGPEEAKYTNHHPSFRVAPEAIAFAIDILSGYVLDFAGENC